MEPNTKRINLLPKFQKGKHLFIQNKARKMLSCSYVSFSSIINVTTDKKDPGRNRQAANPGSQCIIQCLNT